MQVQNGFFLIIRAEILSNRLYPYKGIWCDFFVFILKNSFIFVENQFFAILISHANNVFCIEVEAFTETTPC